ncbi:MAG: peptidase domain-containing ABC transporter [Oceanospirillaceae bacterium]|nr:peptidase domain-containing ABC transporter [Oceanospirillaceae bacterium]
MNQTNTPDLVSAGGLGLGTKLPVILQAEASECGLACLAMIAGFYGFETDLNQLRRRFSMSMHGVNLKQLRDMATRMHLNGRALQLEMEHLKDLQLPCILHWDMNHFVVLKSVRKGRITIHDPGHGVRHFTEAEFGEHFTGIAMELTPTQAFSVKSDKQSIGLSSLWSKSSGIGRSLMVILGLSILLQVFGIAAPFYMQVVVDDVVQRADIDLLLVLALGFGLLMVMEVLTQGLRGLLILHLASHLSLQMANNLFRHLIRLPLQFFEKRHMGDILSRFGSLEQVRELISSGLVAAVVDGVMAIITLVIMFVYSVKLALVVIGVTALYFVLRLALYRPFRTRTEEGLVADAKQQSHFMESIRAIQSIKVFQQENERHSRWQNHYSDTINTGIRIGHWNIGYTTLNQLLFGVENIVIIYLAANAVIDSVISLGMLYAFMSYKQRFISSMDSFITQVIEFKVLGLHLERLSDIVLAKAEEDPETGFAAVDGNQLQLQGHFKVENASFRYSEATEPVFSQLNFDIASGESVALVGPSGCGKTTLVKCLMGLLPLDEGQIYIDDKPIEQSTLFRGRIGAVMQDDQLVSGSLADNISCFDPIVDEARIAQSAAMANIHDDIMAMPMNYNTLVGDMGASLSGGQKQRVLLARALYRKPDVLFLDEATSHLDIAGESIVNEHIKQLKITRIMVAHRPETIATADRVIDIGR